MSFSIKSSIHLQNIQMQTVFAYKPQFKESFPF